MDLERFALWGFLLSFAALSQFLAGWLLRATRKHDPRSRRRCTAYMAVMALFMTVSWFMYGAVAGDVPLMIASGLWGLVTGWEGVDLIRMMLYGGDRAPTPPRPPIFDPEAPAKGG